MENSIRDWWNSVPLITRYLFAGAGGLTLAANFGLVSPMTLVLSWPALVHKYQVWRLITPFFFMGQLGFPFLVNMIFLYRYSTALEVGTFLNRPADYLFMLLFGGFFLYLIGLYFQMFTLGMGLIMMILYVWSRKNPNVDMSFFFGLRFKSAYFPWVLMGFSLLMGGFPMAEIIGVIVGHIYFYLEDIYPLTGGRRLLHTPQFLLNFFGQRPIQRGFEQNVPQQRGHNWGTGQALGN